MQWTKSTGPWTKEIGPVHGSTVDRASHRFAPSNLSPPFPIKRLRTEGVGQWWTKEVRSGHEMVESPARHRNGPLAVGGSPRMAFQGEEMMKIPFLGKVEHERVKAELVMKGGGRWHSVLVEKDGERGRSSVEGRMRGRGVRQSSW
jgi:hypothetical protein